MVFRVAGNHTVKARCETMEMPFRGFWDEKLHQPIFGTNNLTGTLMYYDNQPFQGDLTVKLIFNEGGVGTFLHVFNNVLRATRIQMNRERISNSNSRGRKSISTASRTVEIHATGRGVRGPARPLADLHYNAARYQHGGKEGGTAGMGAQFWRDAPATKQ